MAPGSAGYAFHRTFAGLAAMNTRTHIQPIILLICVFVAGLTPMVVKAQCDAPISSFPYTEGFESGTGGWTPGGTAPSWASGTPAKPVINSAALGNRCWVTGGLNNGFYNDNEASFLQSPCFDLRPLTNPEIRFRVFWETELQFDGANLQYSIDNGTSWSVLGNENSNANCSGTNWYNYNSVQFVGFRPGWSGNVQTGGGGCRNGQGSGQWREARHSLADVAGQPRVLFRFAFGSGRICNAFDGFAIDQVEIREASPNTASVNFTCGSNRQVNFTSSTSACAAAYSWDFGDPASGPDNFSTDVNPAHTFSAPGNYQVSLTVSFLSGPQVQVPVSVNVIEAASSVTSAIRCFGQQTGAISVNIQPPSSYQVSWNTNPVRTGNSISNLPAGSYTAVITGTNTCSVSLTTELTQPPEISLSLTKTDAKCGRLNGSIDAAVSGGVAPYQYAWSNAAATSSISSLSPGTYRLQVTDANNCRVQSPDVVIEDVQNQVRPNLGADRKICPGQSVLLDPGSFASYLWQDGSTGSSFRTSAAGTYFVTVEDADGCSGSDTVKVAIDCQEIYFPNAFTPGNDGLNNGFGPLGGVSSLSDYRLEVYGRWGQLIFSSVNPTEKWDGSYKGLPLDMQTCVWIARFSQGGRKQQTRKGYVLIIR